MSESKILSPRKHNLKRLKPFPTQTTNTHPKMIETLQDPEIALKETHKEEVVLAFQTNLTNLWSICHNRDGLEY